MKLSLERKLPSKVEPNLTPLVDVIFLLLIFFILGASLNNHNVIKIDLPESSNEKKGKDHKTTITIDSQQNIYFNGSLISKKDLKLSLENLEKKEKIILAADKNISYNTIIEVMNIATDGGIKFISLETKGN